MSVVAADFPMSIEPSLFDWPLFGLQDDVRPALAQAADRGVRSVLGTLYGVVGAAPRGIGAQMVFTADDVVGFLSGGCIEADLAVHAQRVLTTRRAERLTYGEGGPVDIRLPCGARIDVLLEPLEASSRAMMRLLQLQQARRPALWLTNGADQACVSADCADEAPAALQSVSRLATSGDGGCGYEPSPFAVFRRFMPRRRLIVVGADPIALAVVKLAVEMGFETLLIRPRGPETCPLPGVRYDRSDVRLAMSAARPDAWTAVAVMTHDIDQECAALLAALGTTAGYIGVLGSRRRTSDRVARLMASGVQETDIARVHAPIGLAIGSKAPWEIAVSVIAEIVRDLDAARGARAA